MVDTKTLIDTLKGMGFDVTLETLEDGIVAVRAETYIQETGDDGWL